MDRSKEMETSLGRTATSRPEQPPARLQEDAGASAWQGCGGWCSNRVSPILLLLEPPSQPFPASCHRWEGSTVAGPAEPESEREQGSASISSVAKESLASKLWRHTLERWPVLGGGGGRGNQAEALPSPSKMSLEKGKALASSVPLALRSYPTCLS